MTALEANFDGLVGPTHNYAGLSFGNVASQNNAAAVSNPKAAALQGLQKAKALADLGLVQGMLPPQLRPDLASLRRVGFAGTDAKVLHEAASHAPQLLNSFSSASCMWTANAATVSPSSDSANGKVHFTPANLVDKLHRSIEPGQTARILQAIFKDPAHFQHHMHLPEHPYFGDEGAANHTRLCHQYGQQGVELFVYGRKASQANSPAPKHFPARQTLEASEAIARLHQLDDRYVHYIQQNPDVIDQGVFHNDVIAVGNQNVLFYHQQAFLNSASELALLQQKMQGDLHLVEVSTEDVSIDAAVRSYLFNTQLVTLGDGSMALIAPSDCQENPQVYQYLQSLPERGSPIKQVKYFDVKQSMQNGGGPACLRLRVALTPAELAAVNPQALLTDDLYQQLTQWIHKHYRDRLCATDLADVTLYQESCAALDELTQIMRLGSIYAFQR
ncbi:N-succinylarginine dihydrolase [Shewanella sp. NIFS-20-20]|uniref:N-succinylarginine dihydrolase n=1 Tax=Shewanella sp. NIFS-20-20 TaxID=2853806 RepID=UPI001C490A6B|nr:N-succinylarginine dihydrolase [Shewanella sp. NIFS-20-20]MBV7315137.1 N-succinylarginine dihydrolase [Shewanella sp. NIFS-20-20]